MVAIYVRVSTLEQAEAGYSIEEQESKLISYCNVMGWSVYKVYKDAGFSGTSLERPQIQLLINDVKSKKIDTVLVWKLDRISRSQKDTMMLLEDVFIKNECNFISVCESFDTSSPFGRASIGILSVFAQLERENLRDRTALGRHARIKKGYTHGSRVPVGYKFKTGSNELLIDNYTAQMVKEVYAHFLNGKSIKSISEYMTDKYGAKNHYVWDNNTAIRRILKNPTYCGKVHFNGVTYNGMHESIISEEDFIKVNMLLKRNKELDKRTYEYKTNTTSSDNLLTGLLYCGDCGARMYARKVSIKTKKYICHSVAKTSKAMIKSENCTNRMHPYTVEMLNNIILDEIEKLSFDKTYFDSISSSTVQDNPNEIYSTRIVEIDKQINKLIDLYQNNIIDAEDISVRVTDLKSEKIKLQNFINSFENKTNITKDDAWNLVKNFQSARKMSSTEQLHSIVHNLIDKIVVLNDDVNVYWSFI